VTRGRLVVHAHFYQPSRVDPFTGEVPPDPTAAPFRDWNERVNAECYRPNAERGTLAHMSWDLGPTLASWLQVADPATHRRFVAADAGNGRTRNTAIAQAYHHAILPLAPAHDRRTEILWGARDFELRFGRRPAAMWLPETAVDRTTLRELVDAGIGATILAPWQAAEPAVDTRRPYRVELGGGRSLTVAFYDATLSAAVSFDPSATSDADRFARERVAPRLATDLPDGLAPMVVIATDGELYGHHQPFRDLFLQRLVAPGPAVPDRGFDVTSLGDALVDHRVVHPVIHVRDRTSWSCHHGVLRWTAECPDVPDGRWKGPLRAALDRLAAAIDTLTEDACRGMPGAPDPWAARDEYIEVAAGVEPSSAFSARWLGNEAPAAARRCFEQLLVAQRWRLAMFASDGWFWDDPVRPETRQVLRAAARAARIVDGLADARLERRLVADLSLLQSPAQGVDGAAIYRAALAEIGQSPPP